MREVIQIQIGACGNRIGSAFWEVIANEHQIDYNGDPKQISYSRLAKADVFFKETADGRYVPRVVHIDKDPTTENNIRNGPFGRLFNPENFVIEDEGSSNLFARAYYSSNSRFINDIRESIRKEAEKCDFLEGFQICNSIGGGTGSGVGSLVLNRFDESDFKKKTKLAMMAFPSKDFSENVQEPLNVALGMSSFFEYCDLNFMFDNSTLIKICQNKLKIQNPVFKNLNSIVASVMSDISCSLRFPGQLNTSLNKICSSLIPLPNMNLFNTSFSPFAVKDSEEHKNFSVKELVKQNFSPDCFTFRANLDTGVFFNSLLVFRGKLSIYKIKKEIRFFEEENKNKFAEFIPSNTKFSVCDIPPEGFPRSSVLIANHSSTAVEVSQYADTANDLFRRKAFIHWSTSEGMDEIEFVEKITKVREYLKFIEQKTSFTNEEEESDIEKVEEEGQGG